MDDALIDDKAPRDYALWVYILQGIGFFLGITWIVGVVINYVKRDEVKGTWVASHFDWQIRTFWIGFVAMIIGTLTTVIGIGFVLLFLSWVWGIYRVVKGWLAFNDRKEIGGGFF
jgi:uncharacterized membrane protein